MNNRFIKTNQKELQMQHLISYVFIFGGCFIFLTNLKQVQKMSR
jgi:hypothetical protein